MSVTLNELLEGLYGVRSSPHINPVTDTVGVTVEKILKNNPNRVSFLIVNLSVNALYIAPGNDVSSSKGIYVAPSGGYASFQWDKDFELVAHDWYAIAGAAASSIYVLENISI